MVASDLTLSMSLTEKIDDKVKCTVIFFVISLKNANFSHPTPSEVGIYGYQMKGLEIPYKLVLGARPYTSYSSSYGAFCNTYKHEISVYVLIRT